MFRELINSLTADQKRELIARGIPQPRLSEWKSGKRLPTRPQVLTLADVTKTDPLQIEAELMLMESAPEQRDIFRRVLEKAGAAFAMLFLVLGLGATPEKAFADKGLAKSGVTKTVYTLSLVYVVWLFGVTVTRKVRQVKIRLGRPIAWA